MKFTATRTTTMDALNISLLATCCITLALPPSCNCQLANFTVIDLLKNVQRMHGFENILIVRHRNATNMPISYYNTNAAVAATTWNEQHFIGKLLHELQVPVLQLNELTTYPLAQQHRHHWQAIAYVDGNWTLLLQQLALNLRHITTTKLLLLLNNATHDEQQLVRVFRLCWQLRLINVLALFADYQKTATAYSYTHFPRFVVEAKPVLQPRLYPTRLQNLQGYQLPIIIGSSEPRIIVYFNERQEMILGGFVGHFTRAFTQKFNCTLVQPIPAKPNAFAPSQELIAAVRNGTVELSLGLTYPLIPFIGYSYPIEHVNWCISIPVEPNVPYYQFFVVVFEASAFALTMSAILVISMLLTVALLLHDYKADLFDFFIHDDCLRGILGQSFSEVLNPPKVVRFIYLQICVLGILLTTTFNAYFSTYVTSPPKQPALRSYDDILHSGLKISAWAPEYRELLGRFDSYKKYQPMFAIEPNYRKYLQQRDSFDTNFGYMMPSTKWNILQEQQKIFTNPLFRLPADLCFFNNIPMCFPVQENSIYIDLLYQLILETAQSGLIDYWSRNAFLELILAGRLTFADLGPSKMYIEMKPADLQYVWIGMCVMAAVTSLIFSAELLWFHRQRIWTSLKSRLRAKCCKQMRVERESSMGAEWNFY